MRVVDQSSSTYIRLSQRSKIQPELVGCVCGGNLRQSRIRDTRPLANLNNRTGNLHTTTWGRFRRLVTRAPLTHRNGSGADQPRTRLLAASRIISSPRKIHFIRTDSRILGRSHSSMYVTLLGFLFRSSTSCIIIVLQYAIQWSPIFISTLLLDAGV